MTLIINDYTLVHSNEDEFYKRFNLSRVNSFDYYDMLDMFKILSRDASELSIKKIQYLLSNKYFKSVVSENVFDFVYPLTVLNKIIPYIDITNSSLYDLKMIENIIKDKYSRRLLIIFRVSKPILQILTLRSYTR